nr:MFS transporter [Alkaliphilus serpentinus]
MAKNKNFSLLMAGKIVSLTGSEIQQFALSLYVLATTGSATVFASVLAITIFPRLILSPFAGVFGDWFDRKRSIVILDFINGMIIGVFGILFILKDGLTLPMIYFLVIALEITEIFFNSAMSPVVPCIVDKEELFDANSISTMVASCSRVLSPILAALLYGSLGIKVILIVNALSFMISAISEMFIDIPKNHKKPQIISLTAFKSDLMDGIHIIRKNPLISSIIGLGTILNFVLAPLYSIGILYIIREVLKGTELQYGLFSAVVSTSMIVSPILCSGIAKRFDLKRLITTSFTLYSFLVMLLAIIPTQGFLRLFTTNLVPYLSLIILTFIMGMIVTVANIGLSTLLQTIVPNEFMGRAGTAMNMGMTISIPIGLMSFGIVLDALSPSFAIMLAGLIIFLGVGIFSMAQRRGASKVEGEAITINP